MDGRYPIRRPRTLFQTCEEKMFRNFLVNSILRSGILDEWIAEQQKKIDAVTARLKIANDSLRAYLPKEKK